MMIMMTRRHAFSYCPVFFRQSLLGQPKKWPEKLARFEFAPFRSPERIVDALTVCCAVAAETKRNFSFSRLSCLEFLSGCRCRCRYDCSIMIMMTIDL